MSDATTRDRILDEAELLFAEHGFEGTSMRAITTAAGVNLAAINYHFGSKTGLLHETMRRRIEPVNQERIRRLDAAVAAASPGAPPVEAIVDAFIRPAVEKLADLEPGCFAGIVQMVYNGEVETEFFRDLFGPVVLRFGTAFRVAAPELSPLELAWRLHFLVGAMLQAFNPRTRAVNPQLAHFDSRAMVDLLVRWATAGFLAAPALDPRAIPSPATQENPA